MSDQLTIDLVEHAPAATGQALKREGLNAISANNVEFLKTMRAFAKEYCSRYGQVTTDNLRMHAEAIGLAPTHCNAWGAILRGKGWKVVGRTSTKLEQGHAREIRVYEWRDA